MVDHELGEKEIISILALEYNSLRSHINARMSSIAQILAFAVSAAALVSKLQSNGNTAAAIVVVLGALGVALLSRDVAKAGKQVQHLEAEINRRANEKLLVWESELGGLTRNYYRY